jgi:two-component system sensor histidine kinase/response regulator
LNFKISSQNLDESNKVKDKLFSIISHDYRGPLASVKSTLGLFEQGLISSEEEKNIVQTVQNEIDHTLNLLDNMLFWANTQLNGIEVNKEPFLLTECIDTTVKLMLPQAQHKDIILQIDNSDMAKVSADKEMVTLVLRNLISNAIKFSKKSDTISIFCIQKDDLAEVHVKDSGIGMSADKKEQLFKFENVQSTYGTNNEKGIGLGLSLCKDFIDRNGGTLYLTSEEGKGSDFYFTLPLA